MVGSTTVSVVESSAKRATDEKLRDNEVDATETARAVWQTSGLGVPWLMAAAVTWNFQASATGSTFLSTCNCALLQPRSLVTFRKIEITTTTTLHGCHSLARSCAAARTYNVNTSHPEYGKSPGSELLSTWDVTMCMLDACKVRMKLFTNTRCCLPEKEQRDKRRDTCEFKDRKCQRAAIADANSPRPRNNPSHLVINVNAVGRHRTYASLFQER